LYLVPGSWLVRPIESVHDLDNIKLSSLQGDAARHGVEALFQLQNILVQGHAREAHTSMPPRGVQYVLGTPATPHMVDTITMTNLGYIQLKADAGVWELRLRAGRSSDVYELLSLSDSAHVSTVEGSVSADGAARVIVNSFEGVTVYPYVRKRPGKETEDVLEPEAPEPKNSSKSGLWDSIKTR
jgi:UDP-glucose:glycoprotein glucosyltransferase